MINAKSNTNSNPYLQELQKILLKYIAKRKVKVYLFGSRAKNTARATSDVDIALLPMESLPDNFFADLRELLEESNLPYTVDIIDLSQIDEAFKQKILQEGILWNG